MRIVRYSIDQFVWDKQTRTFSNNWYNIWDNSNSYIPFLSGRKQFIIYNPTTNGFRRFRFVKELLSTNQIFYIFQSEDGLSCIVNMENPIADTYPKL